MLNICLWFYFLFSHGKILNYVNKYQKHKTEKCWKTLFGTIYPDGLTLLDIDKVPVTAFCTAPLNAWGECTKEQTVLSYDVFFFFYIYCGKIFIVRIIWITYFHKISFNTHKLATLDATASVGRMDGKGER